MLSKTVLAVACGFTSLGAQAQVDPQKLAEAIERQEAELTKLKQELAALKAQQASSEKEIARVEKAASKASVSTATASTSTWDRLSFSSYGTLSFTSDEYFDNVQDTTPERRNRFDLERIVTEFGYQFNEHWDMEVEIEYEHGGTGAALEYDGFDEFGEFETEIEAGGEVLIEKAQIRYRPSDRFGVKFGNIHVPMGLSTILHKPNEYLTVTRHRSEAAMLPATWNEMGIGVFGQFDDFHYQAQLLSGLNSEYFRTYNWVANGHQKRFEHINADEPAFAVRLDYGDFKKGSAVGLAYYYGKTGGNRHKSNKLSADADVSIFSAAAAWVEGPYILRGQYLYGTLSDTNAITQANKTTPGLRPGNFAQLGSESMAFFVEAGLDLNHWFDVPVTVFANLDYANPLWEVENGEPSKRFENTWSSLGLNYHPVPELVIKAEGGLHQVAVASIPDTYFFALGVGYQFKL
ncbi:hypothetical protein L2725_02760 [Shewanella corallii]|uniref:Phosphate-selective porin O and P n=1 Tax=Shewanella corallii TaxID=560080 RepID=A0ABT0N2N9_9GAMM|nr:hypothetical protein [Shewanella corallii]MCL2912711.1 hypothetical protein [Shewanella corallii]